MTGLLHVLIGAAASSSLTMMGVFAHLDANKYQPRHKEGTTAK